jgi:hypothetical protein
MHGVNIFVIEKEIHMKLLLKQSLIASAIVVSLMATSVSYAKPLATSGSVAHQSTKKVAAQLLFVL